MISTMSGSCASINPLISDLRIGDVLDYVTFAFYSPRRVAVALRQRMNERFGDIGSVV